LNSSSNVRCIVFRSSATIVSLLLVQRGAQPIF
jgi:hypothetical protein